MAIIYVYPVSEVKKEDVGTVYSAVMEIGRDKKVLWSVDEKEWYTKDSSFNDSHMNVAYYDKRKKKLYISSRDLYAILK